LVQKLAEFSGAKNSKNSKEEDILFAFNLSTAYLTSEYSYFNFELLPYVDILFCTAEQLKILNVMGPPTEDQENEDSIEEPEND